MKKILDKIDEWKKDQLDTSVRHNLHMANNSFGDEKKQYELKAGVGAKKYHDLTGEYFKI